GLLEARVLNLYTIAAAETTTSVTVTVIIIMWDFFTLRPFLKTNYCRLQDSITSYINITPNSRICYVISLKKSSVHADEASDRPVRAIRNNAPFK
ncbi:MAG: hypothetical protein KAW19_08095, partial [Candidatus Aminicenantes bacterium]|nr:hypothetical protein [Candidatus Aminicenantes bacterium]